MNNIDWSKISFRKPMADEITVFLGTDQAKKYGLTNLTQFVDVAAREALMKYGVPRFEHFEFAHNTIKLIDNTCPNSTPYIEIISQEDELYCKNCESSECVHIEESWDNSMIKSQLMQTGLKEPIKI